jgi:CubicO group peptidase (beta-lactamase class C family)
VTFPDLATQLREHATRHSLPGAALGVLRDGTSATTCYGVADASSGEPVTLETRFAIGSLAKSMVATAVARLASEGRLELEDPVAEHVPELHSSDWARRATVRDLMANRSRLPLQARLEFGDFEGDDAGVLSRFVAEVARGEPTASFWSYTNAGWSLLGRAMETVTGLTREDAMRATLFAPGGMDQTTFATWPAAEPRAAGHRSPPTVPFRWTAGRCGPSVLRGRRCCRQPATFCGSRRRNSRIRRFSMLWGLPRV